MELPLPHPGRDLQRQPAHEALQKVFLTHSHFEIELDLIVPISAKKLFIKSISYIFFYLSLCFLLRQTEKCFKLGGHASVCSKITGTQQKSLSVLCNKQFLKKAESILCDSSRTATVLDLSLGSLFKSPFS